MKSVRLIFLTIFVTLSATTAKHLYEPRIINGHEAKEGQFPHAVSIQFKGPPHFHQCAATILSSRFLLTAAHCCVVIGHREVKGHISAVVGSISKTGGVAYDLDTVTPQIILFIFHIQKCLCFLLITSVNRKTIYVFGSSFLVNVVCKLS